MKQRISGKNVKNPELYAGLSLLSLEEFIEFSQSNLDLQKLYVEWIGTGYDIRFTPSVDRIDSKQGYVLSNIRWITHRENSYRAVMKRHYG